MRHVAYPMAEVAPLVRRPVRVEPERLYQEIGVRSFGKGIFHKPPSTSLEIGDKKVFAIEPGDLLFNIVFAWEGAVAVATERERGAIGSHRFLSCVPDSRLACARYLYWYFVHERGLSQLQRASPGGAGRNRTLGIDKLAAIAVDLPPINEQQRIVAELDGTAERIATLKARSQTAYSEVKVAVRSAFAKVVADAPRARMADVAPLVRRSVEIDSERTYTEIGVRSFYKGIFHRRTVTGAEFTWQKLFRIANRDLVFSNLMAWEQAIALASPTDEGCVGNHRMLTCQVDDSRCFPTFLWYYFTTQEGLAQVLAASPGSIARNKTLSASLLAQITVPVPTLDAQQWFEALHTKTMSIDNSRTSFEHEVDHLMPALLHSAFG